MEISAYAKVNLTFEVLGRWDDGFHQVTTVMQTVGLADVLKIEPASALHVDCEYPELAGEQNLVWHAAAALAKVGNVEPRARITVEKHIPVGMGLGGGSSDAASALLALNRFWDLGLSQEELASIAAGLGSDVSFFIWGGTALAQGRGEQISRLLSVPPLAVTLVFPDLGIENKTAAMYSKLSMSQFSDGGITRRMVQAINSGQFVRESMSGMLFNAFSEIAGWTYPGLFDMGMQVADQGGPPLHLCGAGPALFTLPSSEEEHHRIAELLQPHRAGVYLVNTVPADRCGLGSLPAIG